jgi:hypothetical protein
VRRFMLLFSQPRSRVQQWTRFNQPGQVNWMLSTDRLVKLDLFSGPCVFNAQVVGFSSKARCKRAVHGSLQATADNQINIKENGARRGLSVSIYYIDLYCFLFDLLPIHQQMYQHFAVCGAKTHSTRRPLGSWSCA